MFPTTITIHNISDLQKVMSVLYPAATTDIIDKYRDVLVGVAGTSAAADEQEQAARERLAEKDKPATLTKAQVEAMDDTMGKPAAATAHTPRTAAVEAAAAQDKSATAASTSGTTPSASASDAKPVAYSDLQAKVLALHKRNATAAKPIAEGMGFANFKAMPEEKWAEALKRVEAALEAEGAR